MNPTPHDFRKPPRPVGNGEERLGAWLRVACQLASQRAVRHLPFPVEFTLREVEVLPAGQALASLPTELMGFRAALGPPESNSLFALPRPVALALVAGAVGDSTGALPADRDLTAVEESLCEYLLQQLFARILEETFPPPGRFSVTVHPREPSPCWGRLFGSAEHLMRCSFSLKGPMGEHAWTWLVPPQGTLENLSLPGQVVDQQAQASGARQIEALVRELPVNLVVALGEVELSLAQLGTLKPGDLLILKQRAAEPLMGLVDGQQKFKVWPGRVGSRQAVQVESLIG